MKTNACRLLERLGVPYERLEYAVDPDDLSAGHVAATLGLSTDLVWKTLVVRGDRSGALFAVVPGSAELDLAALARASGDKRVRPVALREVEPLTGYVRGGVTVLGAKRAFPAFVDETIELLERVCVSGGARGLQLCLAPADYLRATGASLAPIAR